MNFINRVLDKFNIKDQKAKGDDYRDKKIFSNLDKNMDFIKTMQGESFDLVSRQFYIESKQSKLKLGIVYINGLIDQKFVNETIIEAMSNNFYNLGKNYQNQEELVDHFRNHIIKITELTVEDNYGQLFNTLLGGDLIILVDNIDQFFIVGSRSYKERALSVPTVDNDVKGPKDAFNESLGTNVTLIRRRIKSPNLWVKKFVVGKDSNTDIAILYLKGVADEQLIRNVENKINEIKAENILSSTYLSYFIKEKQNTIFPLIDDNERPDVAVSKLYEGKVVFLVDGTPFAIFVPTTFIELFHVAEDFYQKAVPSSFFRFLRMLSFFIATFMPAIYLSFVSFHSELIPLRLLIHIAGQRNGVPFPSYIEILLMGMSFDLLREAGIRMPSALGSALSIVGALIIGQSAVEAGLFSPIIVIIVALTAIASLTIPNYNLSLTISVLRYLFLFLAATFGLYGITLGFIALYIHLCSLRSFGVSYMTPISPFKLSGNVDALIRLPLNYIFKRPKNFTDKYPE